MRRVLESKVILWFSIMAASMLIFYFVMVHLLGSWYYRHVAEIAVIILRMLEVPSDVDGNVIAASIRDKWTFIRVGWECSGVVSMTVFTGLVAGFPQTSIRRKLIGLSLGYSAIFIGNLLRIILIIYLSHTFPNISYILFHDFFGRPLSFIWMTIIWFFWFYYTFITKQ